MNRSALSLPALVIAAASHMFAGERVVSDTTEASSNPLLFVVQYTTGTMWDQSKSPNEQTFLKEHSALMQELRKEGTTLVGGRYSDKGLLIMKADSDSALTKRLTNDPSVKHGTMKVEIFPLSVFYDGCVPKK